MRTIQFWFMILVVTYQHSWAVERGSACRTPNDESATCQAVTQCSIIRNAIATNNASAVDFAQKSQCGYDSEPLVCCGSSAFMQAADIPWNIFTQTPQRRPVDNSKIFTTSLPDRTVCGIEKETQRLSGADLTDIDEFPWMALVQYNNARGEDAGFKCGGTLINNRYVLTAAHCILTGALGITPVSVRLGEWKISTEIDCVSSVAIEECSDPVQDIVIKEAIPHAFYSNRNGNNDIGLLKLQRDVEYSDFIRPICIPPPNIPPPAVGTWMTVSGWGAVENGSVSDVKLKIRIPLVENGQCKSRLTNYTYISANQICAGGVEGKDACQGDSGGPLMRTYIDDESQWYQEGVVSRGKGCGKKNFPGVYTRVTRYVHWIVGTIESSAD